METITLHDQMDSGGSGVADGDEDGGEVVLITVVGLVWRWTNFSVGFQSPHYLYFNLPCPNHISISRIILLHPAMYTL